MKIKKVYSFIGATILLDLATPMGKAIIQQIHPYACQQLSQGNSEFRQLYRQVEEENSPHELGTGTAESSEGISAAFLAWLKTRGINITDISQSGGKISVFGGNAQNPQNGKSFEWSAFFYFDIEK